VVAPAGIKWTHTPPIEIYCADETKNGSRAIIEVHHFRVWNNELKHWEKPPSKRSAEDIAKLKGEIIPDTGQMVFKAMLDSEGRYFPEKSHNDGT
jgi:hypothetical protein